MHISSEMLLGNYFLFFLFTLSKNIEHQLRVATTITTAAIITMILCIVYPLPLIQFVFNISHLESFISKFYVVT